MKQYRTIFNDNPQRGGMLIELMLSIALAVIIIPFIFRYHQNAVQRTENIAVTRQMAGVQTALERYIAANRDALLAPVGKNITRVTLTDLIEFGLSEDLAAEHADDYQLRILKSADAMGQATLQGVIVFSDDEISPLRTREIVNIAGDGAGFVDNGRAYGTFGAWRTSVSELGIDSKSGIVETTGAVRDNAKYLWRLPSVDMADATMLSALSLGGHDIVSAAFVNGRALQFDETLSIGEAVADNLIFQARTSIDGTLNSTSATVAGTLSSDGKNMDVAGNITMADTGKFSNFVVDDLYVTNMELSGINVDTTDNIVTLKINQALDMTQGRIDAMFVTVGFAGSITPRLEVKNRIEDSTNAAYYWDAETGVANFSDLSLGELSRMAPDVVASGSHTTTAYQIFSAVSANKNATVSDYMRAITQIQQRVREKYQRLNLD